MTMSAPTLLRVHSRSSIIFRPPVCRQCATLLLRKARQFHSRKVQFKCRELQFSRRMHHRHVRASIHKPWWLATWSSAPARCQQMPTVRWSRVTSEAIRYASNQIGPIVIELCLLTELLQQHQCFKNLAAVLEAAGSSINHVVKMNVYLTDIADFDAMNEVYKQYLGPDKPART